MRFGLRDFNGHKRIVASSVPESEQEERQDLPMSENQNQGISELVGNAAELPADVAALIRKVVKTGLIGVVNVGETGATGTADTVRTGLSNIDRLVAQIEEEYRKLVKAATGGV